MSDSKAKRASKEATTTTSSVNNSDTPKPDDESEHASISKNNGSNRANGNSTLPHGKKNGSSGELSTSSKKNSKADDNPASPTTTTTTTTTPVKKAFTELTKKKVDKKRPNESSASSISKSDVSKKSDESTAMKAKAAKRPKYHVKKNEKLKLHDDSKPDSAGAKDKDDSGRGTPAEGTSKSHGSPGFNERSPINGGKESASGAGTPNHDNQEDGGMATPIDPNAENNGEYAEGLSIQGTATSNSSSSFQPAPTLVENPKPLKKSWTTFWKSWPACFASKLPGDASSQLADTDQNSSEKSSNKSPDVPDIPTQYRPKEINGFGMFSKSQSLPMETKKNYHKLLSTSLELILEFCRYLEILNERSGKQDIQDAFLIQFGRFHSGLPFTDTEGSEVLNEEELVQLSSLFNDIYNNNNTIWIANKFEYTSFSRKFRKAISETLESDYQIKISHKRNLFPRQVICASLIQWKRNIPFS
ncbi:hypothetical protein Cantr_03889 [Candida viswanathii]|uniref:Uncharacterized protein n=1 Tax=Candida viswanathii TaxID=5486 RepID=A0A367XLD4_9ASCO|nr:hypothetical protein Cantr_03889 [Candida viswanathii]